MSLHFAITIAVLVAAIGLFAFASWRANQPANPLKPRLVPWRLLIIVAGAACVLAIVHLVNMMGVVTGGQPQSGV